MYARFLIARNGIAAEKIAREKAKPLQQEDDLNGHKVWKTRSRMQLIVFSAQTNFL